MREEAVLRPESEPAQIGRNTFVERASTPRAHLAVSSSSFVMPRPLSRMPIFAVLSQGSTKISIFEVLER